MGRSGKRLTGAAKHASRIKGSPEAEEAFAVGDEEERQSMEEGETSRNREEDYLSDNDMIECRIAEEDEDHRPAKG